MTRTSAIYRKELLEAVRDRRTIFANVVIPVVFYPAMMLLMTGLIGYQTRKLETDRYRIGVTDEEARQDLEGIAATYGKKSEESPREAGMAELGRLPGREGAPRLEFVVVAGGPGEDRLPALKRSVVAGEVQAAIAVAPPQRREQELTAHRPVEVTLFYDQAELKSLAAASRLRALFDHYAQEEITKRLRRLELERERFLQPFVFNPPREQAVASGKKEAGFKVGLFAPAVLILMILAGAIHPAIDLTAGERERGTLETLMVSPARPLEIIIGKFLAVVTVALVSALFNVTSLGAALFIPAGAHEALFGGVGGGGAKAILWRLPLVVVVLAPFALFFSALLLAVSAFAKSFREAQSYVAPVYITAMLPVMAGMVPGLELEGIFLVLPAVNVVLLCRDLFVGSAPLFKILFVFSSTALYAAAAIVLAARLYSREEVIFAGEGAFKLLLSRKARRPRPRPEISEALLLIALCVPLVYYVGLLAARVSPRNVHSVFALSAALQWLAFFCFPACACWYLKINPRETFSCQRPPLAALAGALLMGVSAWVPSYELTLLFKPLLGEEAPGAGEALQKVALLPLGFSLLLLAVTPAVCEEVLFRGFLTAGFRSALSGPATVLLVAAVFSLAHFEPLRLPYTFFLGAVLTALVLRSGSIFPAILFHLLNNVVVVFLLRRPELFPQELTGGENHLPVLWLVFGAGLFLLGAALAVFPRSPPAAPAQS